MCCFCFLLNCSTNLVTVGIFSSLIIHQHISLASVLWSDDPVYSLYHSDTIYTFYIKIPFHFTGYIVKVQIMKANSVISNELKYRGENKH
jgi:hypothetical protein